MRKILASILVPLAVVSFALPLSARGALTEELPEANYSHERSIASAFLESIGVKSVKLEVEYSSDQLVTFADERAAVYVIVASEEYERYLDSPVLAWGEGDTIWKYSGIARYSPDSHLVDRYESQLKGFKENNTAYKAPELPFLKDRASRKAPLLGDIKYGQEAPYNKYFPTQSVNGKISHYVVGCGPVALAQVLSYYRSKTPPTGEDFIKTGQGTKHTVRFQEYPFTWNESNEALARLMLCAAASVNATVSPEGSASALADFKYALLSHWHYSPRCRYFQKASDIDALSRIYVEIDERRPVIVADSTHMYVCDGYYKDYIHLNLGWDGSCNGYYRAFLSQGGEPGILPFREILTGILPLDPSAVKSVEVTVPKGGALASALDESQRDGITKLTVKGTLNGEDIAIVSQMARDGSLMELDLSDATIVDGGCYITRSADNMSLSGYYSSGKQKVRYHFDMSSLKPGQWKEMERMGLTDTPTRVIKKNPTGGYTASWFADNSTIGPYMFDGCENLLRIVLPRGTREVKGNAFFGCHSLVSVTGLPKNTSPKAFNNSRLGR